MKENDFELTDLDNVGPMIKNVNEVSILVKKILPPLSFALFVLVFVIIYAIFKKYS